MGRPNCAADRSAHSRRSAFRDKEWVGAIVREEQSSLDQSLNCAICYICFNQTCECAYLTRDVRLRRDSNVTYAHSQDRKSTRLNSSHSQISYAVFCLKKKKTDPVLEGNQVDLRPETEEEAYQASGVLGRGVDTVEHV